MKRKAIPEYVIDVYTHFGIAQEDFEEHYKLDCKVRGSVRKNVAETYKMIHRSLQRDRRM
jgi:hypothetical protein